MRGRISTISLAVLTQYRIVADRRTSDDSVYRVSIREYVLADRTYYLVRSRLHVLHVRCVHRVVCLSVVCTVLRLNSAS